MRFKSHFYILGLFFAFYGAFLFGVGRKKCEASNQAILRSVELAKLKSEVLESLRNLHPNIRDIYFKTGDAQGAFDKTLVLSAESDAGVSYIGHIDYRIHGKSIRTDEGTQAEYRGQRVNRLIIKTLLHQHPQIDTIESIPFETNRAFFATYLEAGRQGSVKPDEPIRYDSSPADRRRVDAQILKRLTNLSPGANVKDLRDRVLFAALESNPKGRNSSAIGFAHLKKAVLKKLSTGELDIEIEYGRGERNDEKSQIYFVNWASGGSVMELKADGTIEYQREIP